MVAKTNHRITQNKAKRSTKQHEHRNQPDKTSVTHTSSNTWYCNVILHCVAPAPYPAPRTPTLTHTSMADNVFNIHGLNPLSFSFLPTSEWRVLQLVTSKLILERVSPKLLTCEAVKVRNCSLIKKCFGVMFFFFFFQESDWYSTFNNKNYAIPQTAPLDNW